MENNLTNKTKASSIFWWTIKRYIPVSIAYWILLFISFPMVELFMSIVITASEGYKEYVDVMKEGVIFIVGIGFTSIAIVFSLITSIIAFSYMHNKRSMDFFGSLPVSRRTMFFARLIAVVLLTIVPVFIIGLAGICLSGSLFAAMEILKVIGIVILATVGNIVVVAFISLCCGTTIDIIISYVAINAAYPICIAIFNFFPSSVVPGMDINVWNANVYTLFCPVASVYTMIYARENVVGILWWLLVISVIVAASYFLCKKRKSELAQNTYVFSPVEIVVKYIVGALAGFGLGWIMAFVGSVHGSIVIQYFYFVIGLVMGIIVANILLHLIFHRGLNGFPKTILHCAIMFVVCSAYLLVVGTGAFGYDIKLPDKEEIVGVSMTDTYENVFYIDGKNILLQFDKDEEKIDDIYEVHQKVIDINKDKTKFKLYPITGLGDYMQEESSSYFAPDLVSDLKIDYQLENGDIFSRYYTYGEIGVDINSKLMTAYENKNLFNLIPDKYAEYIYLDLYVNDVVLNVNIDDAEMKDLLQIVKTDQKKYGEISEENALGQINVDYNDDQYNYVSAYVYFDESYVNVIKFLENKGYKNYMLKYLNDLYTFDDYDIVPDNITKTEQEIYFELPEGMDPYKEVRCLQGYRYYQEYMCDLQSDLTLCEHVEDNIWKYTLCETEHDDDYSNLKQGIIICQITEDDVINSGMILLPEEKDKNLLKLGDRILYDNGDPKPNDFYEEIYDYEWNVYKK